MSTLEQVLKSYALNPLVKIEIAPFVGVRSNPSPVTTFTPLLPTAGESQGTPEVVDFQTVAKMALVAAKNAE